VNDSTCDVAAEQALGQMLVYVISAAAM